MLRSSVPFLLFDYFRVPYRVDRTADPPSFGRLWPEADESTALYWLPSAVDVDGRRPGAYRLERTPLFCAVLPDESTKPWLSELGGEWHRSTSIHDEDGAHIASVWRDGGGRVFLPFDPDEAIERYWSERYLEFLGNSATKALRSSARRTYYRVRPIVPRTGQIWARRVFSAVQKRTSFPAGRSRRRCTISTTSSSVSSSSSSTSRSR